MLIEGIIAVWHRKSTFGIFVRINLNPIGERKFLFET
jgi:hypothetical protein